MLDSFIWEKTIQLVKDPVIISDKSGNILFINSAQSQISGWELNEVIDKSDKLLYSIINKDSIPNDLNSGALGLPFPAVTDLYKKDGTKLTLNGTFYFLNRPIKHKILVLHPFLQHSFKQSSDDFVSTVSHELRTPLTSIKGFADTLLRSHDKITPENRNRFLQIIKDQADHVTRLVEDLLFISRLDNHQIHLVTRSIDIKRLIDKICETISQQAHGRAFVYDFQVENLTVLADSDRLEQILSNLLTNAVKYSPDNTTIKISIKGSEEDEHFMKVSVTDEGFGIPAENQDVIFNRFSRIDNPLTRQVQGTGLGLYICRSLVQAMKGRIWLEKSDQSGSTFSFVLPFAS